MSAGKLGAAALAAPTRLVSSTARADTTERVNDAVKAPTVLTGTGANARSAAHSLDFKTLLALAAAALPALAVAVAAILGSTLITAVSQAEHDFLLKHSQYVSEIADVGLRLDTTIADLRRSASRARR